MSDTHTITDNLEDMTPAALLREQALSHPDNVFLVDADTMSPYMYQDVEVLVRHVVDHLGILSGVDGSDDGSASRDVALSAVESEPANTCGGAQDARKGREARLASRAQTICAWADTHAFQTDAGSWYLTDCTHVAGIVVLIALSVSERPVCLLNARLSDDERQVRIDELKAAESLAGNFQESASLMQVPGVIMFTSGTTGTPKGVHLRWEALFAQAHAFNKKLAPHTRGDRCDMFVVPSTNANQPDVYREYIWQACLPFYHVGGLQVIMRTLVAGACCVLHKRADAREILNVAVYLGVSHISVVDKLLVDLLQVASEDETGRLSGALSEYHAILLGGAAPNQAHLARAYKAGAQVWVSYGATELGSNCALAQVDAAFNGGLELLEGYEAQIRAGELLISGPSVCSGYINAPTPIEDGWYKTGDVATLTNGRLFIQERVADMFVSGGENIYPVEIRQRLCEIPDVADAFVTSRVDEVWGRRPVAVVATPFAYDVARTREMLREIHAGFSRLLRPDAVLFVPELPLMGIGKPDRAALEDLCASSVSIKEARVYRTCLPLASPIRTAKTTMDAREFLFIELIDADGKSYWGEVDSFDTPWYLPETLDDDERFLGECALPALLGRAFRADEVGCRDFDALLAELDPECAYPMATFGLSSAFHSLVEGRVSGKAEPQPRSAARSICTASPFALSATASAIGLDVSTLRERVDRALAQGCARIKIKIDASVNPAEVLQVVQDFSSITFVLDANQSLTSEALDTWERVLTSLGATPKNLLFIEEPASTLEENLHALTRLQIPVALDESWTSLRDIPEVFRAIGAWSATTTEKATASEEVPAPEEPPARKEAPASENAPACEESSAPEEPPASENAPAPVLVIKPGKLSTYTQMYEVIDRAHEAGVALVLGGMFESSLGKHQRAHEEMRGDFTYPGDISDPRDIFEVDIWDTEDSSTTEYHMPLTPAEKLLCPVRINRFRLIDQTVHTHSKKW